MPLCGRIARTRLGGRWSDLAGALGLQRQRTGFAFNPDAARLRLDRAGFPFGAAARGDAEPFALQVPGRETIRGSSAWPCSAETARRHRRRHADSQPVPVDGFRRAREKGDFDAFLFEMAGRSLSWVYDFWRSPRRQSSLINTGYTAGDRILDGIRGAQVRRRSPARRGGTARACFTTIRPRRSWRGRRRRGPCRRRSTSLPSQIATSSPTCGSGAPRRRCQAGVRGEAHHVAIRAADRDRGGPPAGDLRRACRSARCATAPRRPSARAT